MSRVLPAIVSALLLGACQGASPAPPVAKSAVIPDSADQMMYGVVPKDDAGVRRAEVRADTAYMYDQNTRTDLRKVRTEFFKVTGEKNATLTSLTGQYNSRLGTMEARGMVVVVTTDGRKLESPHLRYDPGRNEISSDSVFILTQTDRRVEGVGFISDPDLKNIKVLRNAKAFGQEITIPKQ